jgi:hypothetical protein
MGVRNMTMIHIVTYQERKKNALTNRWYWVGGKPLAFITAIGAREAMAALHRVNQPGIPRRYRHIHCDEAPLDI